MTITNDDNDRHQNRCEKMEANDNNVRSQYTIGSNDFIRKSIQITDHIKININQLNNRL